MTTSGNAENVRALKGERLEQERGEARRRAAQAHGGRDTDAQRPCIDVTRRVQPQFSALVCRCKGRWPPDDALVSYLVMRLLVGLEDEQEWSADVRLALKVDRAARAGVARAIRCEPDVREQCAAGREVLRTRVVQLMKRRRQGFPRFGDQARATFVRESLAMQATAMRAVAERQRQRRIWAIEEALVKPGPRQKRHLKLRSVIDGWNWHDGRPPTIAVTELLLRVEVWADVRAQVRPADGRVSRTDATTELLVSDLKTRVSATYIKRLQVRFSQALASHAETTPEDARPDLVTVWDIEQAPGHDRLLKVRATLTGKYGGEVRQVGDVFALDQATDYVHGWMARVPADTPIVGVGGGRSPARSSDATIAPGGSRVRS